jgi:hypothetical protein
MTDPICGNCGKAYSKHYHENYGNGIEHFCTLTTNGDIFTDTPLDGILFDMLCNENPNLYEELLTKWRKANGHTTQESP